MFETCTLARTDRLFRASLDLRDVRRADVEGFDAVIHLAALSNDPLGNLDPKLTFEINHQATIRLAEAARDAGVWPFLYASSCSLYGVAGNAPVTEEADFNPVTPYGESRGASRTRPGRLAPTTLQPYLLTEADRLRVVATASRRSGGKQPGRVCLDHGSGVDAE